MIKKLFYFFLALLFIGCKNNNSNQSKSIQNAKSQEIIVDIKENRNINLSDIFSNIKYTELETKDQFLVGDVDRIKVIDEKLYLLSSKRLISFDANNGSAHLSIQKLGYSQEEYISLYDMYIDHISKQIELLDMNGKKINIYNYQGDYIKSISLPFFSISFTKSGNNEYFFYNNNLASDITNSKLIHYNSETGKIEHEYIEIDEHLSSYYFVVEGNNFNNSKNRTFFCCPSNIIYEIANNKSIKPIYNISFGKNQPPNNFYQKKYLDIADFAREANKNEYIYFINDIVENDNYISFGFRLANLQYWAFFNKNTNETIITNSITDNMMNHTCKYNIEYNNFPVAIDNQNLYFLLQPHQFIKSMNNLKKEIGEMQFEESIGKRNDIKKILQSSEFNEQSNPILVTCNFKPNE